MNAVFNCVRATWSPTIGDPSLIGWITVIAYAAAAILTWAVFYRRAHAQRLFWLILTVVLCGLAVNKQLDLQSALTATGRCSAQIHGWYDQRGTVQILFILAIAVTCLLCGCAVAWTLRHDFRKVWLALLGVVFLLAFVAIRAAGFHHVDRFIGLEVANLRLNLVLELGGISMIALNAVILLSVSKRQVRR